MKSALLITVSAMACFLPILCVGGQLQAAWKVSNEGSTHNQGFISTNGLASSLPLSLLQQLFTGNNSSANLFRIFNEGATNGGGNAVTPSPAGETLQTAHISQGDILHSVTLASHTDKFNWTMAPQSTTETITETVSKTTTETIPETITETVTKTTTETIPETITETVFKTTTETIPETKTETIPEITTETITETSFETSPADTYFESTHTTTPTTTPTITPTTTPTTTAEKADDRPVPGKVDVGADDLFYFKSNQSLSVTGCRTYCLGFRSFRLATAKTNESMDALRSHGSVMIDMSVSYNPRTSEVRYIWGDGSELDMSLTKPDLNEPVRNSGRSSVMVMFKSGTNVILDDAPSSYTLPCLCQGTQALAGQ